MSDINAKIVRGATVQEVAEKCNEIIDCLFELDNELKEYIEKRIAAERAPHYINETELLEAERNFANISRISPAIRGETKQEPKNKHFVKAPAELKELINIKNALKGSGADYVSREAIISAIDIYLESLNKLYKEWKGI